MNLGIKRINNKKNILMLALACSVMISTSPTTSAIEDVLQEEKIITPAQLIEPNGLINSENSNYDEGILIKKIEINGNNLINADDILSGLSIKEGTEYDRTQIKDDLRKIYEMGYFTDKLKVIPSASSSGITLKIQVEENVPVTGFNIIGNNVLETADILELVNSQAGLPQNISQLNKAISEIENKYAKKGYILARVKKVSDDPDGVINIEINEGIIDDIKISGNTRTKDFVIKRNVKTKPNTVYNEESLKQDFSRLFGTQAFADVRRVISVSDTDPDKYQLTIEVDEKRTGSISLGGGLDTSSGLFGSVGFSDTNFRGNGQELSLTGMSGSGTMLNNRSVVDKANFQFEARFLEPRFKQSLTSLEVAGFGKKFSSFQVPLGVEKRIGGEVTVGRPFKKLPHLAGSVSFGVEDISLTEGDKDAASELFQSKNIDIARRAEQLVGGTYISMGPKLVYDTRNSIINPREGSYSSLAYKHAIEVSGDAGSFGRATASFRNYVPVGKKSTFTFGGKVAGTPFNNIPEFAAFRLGGGQSIRGFREGDVGYGRGFMMASAEYRTPIPFIDKLTKSEFLNNIRHTFFVDAGSMFNETLSSDIYDLPGYGISVGTGLRIVIPGMGPINLDYGIPVTNVGSNNKSRGRFTFGFGESY